jgi:hypothetical protein
MFPFTSLILLVLLTAFVTLDNVFEKLGLQESEARKFVVSNVLGNYSGSRSDRFVTEEFDLPRARLLSSVVSGDKVGAARELCVWLKDYTRSSEFIQAYTQRREALKPKTNNSVRPDEETIAMTRESLKSTEKELASLKKMKNVPAASLAAMESGVIQQRALLKEWEDPFPALTRWQEAYPANPQEMIRRRLQGYLDLAATVDYDAKLTDADRYGIRKFIRPDYEKKSNQWKAIYRAGREVNGVVSAYVRDWLKELAPAAPSPVAASQKAAPAKAKPAAGRKQ